MRLALALTLSLIAANAHAQNDDERARTHFDSGRSYYEEGAYEQSLQEFERAYALSQRPAMLSNMANCEERLGRWAAAADHLEQFMATLPEDDAQRGTMARRVENLRHRAAAHEAPPDRPAGGGGGGGSHPASDGLLIPGAVLLGVGGASLIAWGILGGLALAEESSVAGECGMTMSCTPERVQAMDDYALGADIAMSIGLALAATGAILLIVDPPHGASNDVALYVAPSASGLMLAGRMP